jgi:capsular polysaccharide biosynthesis protein/Mrp family chromosome partitioning ATPase
MSPDAPLSEAALPAYARAVRAHWRLILLVTLVAVAGGFVSSTLRSPRYKATADLLVTPVAQDDRALIGINVIRETGNPTRTIQTAAALVDSRRVAELAAAKLPGWTPGRVLDATDVNPRGETNVLAIQAEADEAQLAARVANQLAESAVGARSHEVLGQVDAAIKRLQRNPAPRGTEPGSRRLAEQRAERLAELQAVRDRGRDPTLSLVQRATPRASAVGAPLALVMTLAGLIGLALGLAAAIALELLSKRIRDEEELLRLYPLPLLGRIPRPKRRLGGWRHRSPFASPPAVREAFQTLSAQLDRGLEAPRSIMVTSASQGDGKTTAVANLAVALSESGHSVVALDLGRRPELTQALGVYVEQEANGQTAVNRERPDGLLEAPNAPGLRVFPAAAHPGRPPLEALTEARQSGADFVLLDIDSLGEAGDALRLAPRVDDVILVARVGHTERRQFEFARDLLERIGARPSGLLEFDESEVPSGRHVSANGDRSAGMAARSRDG